MHLLTCYTYIKKRGLCTVHVDLSNNTASVLPPGRPRCRIPDPPPLYQNTPQGFPKKGFIRQKMCLRGWWVRYSPDEGDQDESDDELHHLAQEELVPHFFRKKPVVVFGFVGCFISVGLCAEELKRQNSYR